MTKVPYYYYTDGSVQEVNGSLVGTAGFGYYVMDIEGRSLKLGDSIFHGIPDIDYLETVAILEAVKHAFTIGSTTIYIYSDSMIAIRSIKALLKAYYNKAKLPKWYTKEVLTLQESTAIDTAQHIIHYQDTFAAYVGINWVKGHCDSVTQYNTQRSYRNNISFKQCHDMTRGNDDIDARCKAFVKLPDGVDKNIIIPPPFYIKNF